MDTVSLVYVRLSYASFGLVVFDKKVIDAPPIAKWTIGRDLTDVIKFYKNKGAEIIWQS
jgi:hypothetical protein